MILRTDAGDDAPRERARSRQIARGRSPLNNTVPLRDFRELLDRSAERFGEREAFGELTRSGVIGTASFEQLRDDVAAVGTCFIERGFSEARIGVLGENSYAWVLAYFAATTCGAVVVPLDKELDAAALADQMRRASVTVLCHTAQYAHEAQAAAAALEKNGCEPAVCLDFGSLAQDGAACDLLAEGKALRAAGDDRYDCVVLDRDRVCAILFTSGTTGASKGVMLTQKNLCANMFGASELVLYEPEDVFVSVLPLHHAYEAMAGMLCPFAYGSFVALCPEVKQLPRYMEEFSPTVMCLVPLYIETFYRKIKRTAAEGGKEKTLDWAVKANGVLQRCGIDASRALFGEARAAFGGRLAMTIVGGAPLDPRYAPFFQALGIAIVQGYGISECSPIVAVNRNHERKNDAVGRVVSCADVAFDDGGQVLVKGDIVMAGYLDDEEATRACLRDGWFATGDLGHLDEDGFLHLTGRCKDIIVLSNGKNVMPQVIEKAICSSGFVTEAVVVPDGDGTVNTALAAQVYVEGAARGETERAELVAALASELQRVNRSLPYYQRIAMFSLRDEPFEKTTTRKIKRYAIRKEEEMFHV